MPIPRFWTEIRYFDPSEFDSPDQPGSGAAKMDETLVRMLDQARALAGVAFSISSGYRTPFRNTAIRGAKNSAHLDGLAADIRVTSPQRRYKIMRALLAVGFDRIEDAPGHIHVDVAHDELHPANWMGFYDTARAEIR